MNKFAILLIFHVLLTSTSVAINVPAAFGRLEAEAGFGLPEDYDLGTGDFPGNTEVAAFKSYGDNFALAHITYEAVNNTREASFELEVDLLAGHEPWLDNANAKTTVWIGLNLQEPVMYSITGSLVCVADVPGVDFHAYWTLFNGDTGIYYYWQYKRAQNTVILKADEFSDPWAGPAFPSDLTGIIPPGVYSLFFVAEFDADDAFGSTVHVTGFTNLTLTRLVPEPSTIAMLIIMLGNTLSGRLTH